MFYKNIINVFCATNQHIIIVPEGTVILRTKVMAAENSALSSQELITF